MMKSPQTIASDLANKIYALNLEARVSKFVILRRQDEARKLLQTDTPYLGYLFLSALTVFDDSLSEAERLKALQDGIEKAKRLPNDINLVESFYLNGLVRLGRRELAYDTVRYLVETTEDNINALFSYLDRARFTGQLSLIEQILDKLERLGCDVEVEKMQMQVLSEVINEQHLKSLLADADVIIKKHSLINVGSGRHTLGNDFYFDLLMLAGSDEDAVATCDVELSRLKITYAQKHGIDLNRFVFGCGTIEVGND